MITNGFNATHLPTEDYLRVKNQWRLIKVSVVIKQRLEKSQKYRCFTCKQYSLPVLELCRAWKCREHRYIIELCGCLVTAYEDVRWGILAE